MKNTDPKDGRQKKGKGMPMKETEAQPPSPTDPVPAPEVDPIPPPAPPARPAEPPSPIKIEGRDDQTVSIFKKPVAEAVSAKKVSSIKRFISNKRNIFVAVIILVVIAVLFKMTSNIQQVLLKKKSPDVKKMVSFEEEAAPVKALKIRRMDFKDTLPCIGNIKGFKEIDLKFQTAGMIESFNFEDGEKIQEGDIIASLIQKDALLKLKYAETEITKNQKLFDVGAISQLKLDQAKLEYESAKSELDKTNIYAMQNGLLGMRTIDVGSYVTPADRVGAFVTIDKVYADYNIIEKDAPKIALGQKVDVFVDAYPNKAFSGVLDRISPIIEGRSKTQAVKVEVENKDGVLKPGMFTRALIYTYEKKDALVIPTSGMKKKEADYFVYVVHKEEARPEAAADEKKTKEKKKGAGFLGLFGMKKAISSEEAAPESKEKAAEFGTLEIRKVTLGYMTQDLVEIADGLKEDEVIVIEAQEEFKDKQRVELMEVQEGII